MLQLVNCKDTDTCHKAYENNIAIRFLFKYNMLEVFMGNQRVTLWVEKVYLNVA